MIKRTQQRLRSTAIDLLDRSGHLDRALELRQRVRRRAHDRQERSVRRHLQATIRGLDSTRSTLVAGLGGRPGRRFGIVGRTRGSDRVVDAMQWNRDLVIEALEAAEIPYQALPVDSPHRYRVAVPGDARASLLRALCAIDVTIHVYIDQSAIPAAKRIVRLEPDRLPQIERTADYANVLRVFEYLALADGTDVYGDIHGCEVEFWTDLEDGTVHSTRWNELVVAMPAGHFGRAEPSHDLISNPVFPIDLVYTWVDGDDPDWRERRARAAGHDLTDERHDEAASEARYTSRNELRYSLRSVERYADFVNHIYVVTDQQRPDWLDPDADGITIVDHTEIFPDDSMLPTFNSHAIESRLHHVPGLSEHYVYLNDDFFFGRRVLPQLFFMSNGLAKHFLSRSLIPLGASSIEHKPVDAAAMTGRDLIEDVFRVSPTQKFKHAPYAQLRSVNLEIESLFADEVERTTASRFRHPSDLAVASSLHHHVAYLTGRGVPGSVAARYVDLGQANLQARLDGLLAGRDFDTFCLNDSDLGQNDEQVKSELVAEFLASYLPVKSRFEL